MLPKHDAQFCRDGPVTPHASICGGAKAHPHYYCGYPAASRRITASV